MFPGPSQEPSDNTTAWTTASDARFKQRTNATNTRQDRLTQTMERFIETFGISLQPLPVQPQPLPLQHSAPPTPQEARKDEDKQPPQQQSAQHSTPPTPQEAQKEGTSEETATVPSHCGGMSIHLILFLIPILVRFSILNHPTLYPTHSIFFPQSRGK